MVYLKKAAILLVFLTESSKKRMVINEKNKEFKIPLMRENNERANVFRTHVKVTIWHLLYVTV